MSNSFPTITAVMVTMGRFELVRESVACFQKQTYPEKKLLIVTDCQEAEHVALKKLANKEISVLHTGNHRKTLGELRNISLEYASDLSIQWDDDDLFDAQRMMIQWRALRDAKAVMLTEQLHYFRDTGEVAWVVDPNGIEGTLLMDRRSGIRYPAKTHGEDTVVKKELQKRNLLNLVPGGICYCRTYHGTNTWDRNHHLKRAMSMGQNLSDEKLQEAAKIYNWKNWRFIGKADKV